ncbi:MAG: sigma-70 family RNA polymerase sigma factor [Treponema sp.]|nr:sigma-70 family RNA polymerase sigma factor [Treponema sp.]
MNDSMISIYMRQIEKIPLLSVEEEKALLIQASNGSKSAKDKLIQSNLRFVVKIANLYKNRGVDIEDLICEGNEALLKAIEKMDLSKNVRFITYASFWIKQYMKAAIYKTGRAVSIPQNKSQELKNTKWKAASLDQPFNDSPDSLTLMDCIQDEVNLNPEDECINEILCKDVKNCLNKLKSNESQVLIKHYGLDGKETMSFSDIGKDMNYSREGVRQMEARALNKIRQMEEFSDFEINVA